MPKEEHSPVAIGAGVIFAVTALITISCGVRRCRLSQLKSSRPSATSDSKTDAVPPVKTAKAQDFVEVPELEVGSDTQLEMAKVVQEPTKL